MSTMAVSTIGIVPAKPNNDQADWVYKKGKKAISAVVEVDTAVNDIKFTALEVLGLCKKWIPNGNKFVSDVADISEYAGIISYVDKGRKIFNGEAFNESGLKITSTLTKFGSKTLSFTIDVVSIFTIHPAVKFFKGVSKVLLSSSLFFSSANSASKIYNADRDWTNYINMIGTAAIAVCVAAPLILPLLAPLPPVAAAFASFTSACSLVGNVCMTMLFINKVASAINDLVKSYFPPPPKQVLSFDWQVPLTYAKVEPQLSAA